MSKRLKIGITQGDTNGVGWEVILKIFSDNRLAELFTPVIYGSGVAAAYYQKRLNDIEPVKFVVRCTVLFSRFRHTKLVLRQVRYIHAVDVGKFQLWIKIRRY